MKKILLTLCLVYVSDFYSHEFNPAHLVVDEIDETNNYYEATWTVSYTHLTLPTTPYV